MALLMAATVAHHCLSWIIRSPNRPMPSKPSSSCAGKVRGPPIRCTTAWKSPHLLTGGSLDDFDLVLRQVVQFVHQRVNLAVGGFDLPLVQLLIGGDGSGGEFAV